MLAVQTLDSDHELTMFIRDALRFISAFITPISQSAPQIYVSSLSFAPEQSLVAKKFCSRFPNTIVVTEGKPSQWPMTVFTAEHYEGWVCHLVFSPDESTFAFISSRIMRVCDSQTGHCVSGPFKLPHNRSPSGACFSPDGKHILLKYDSYAVLLDIEMGEEQFQIKGSDFVFIHRDGRIATTHWIDKDGNSIQITTYRAEDRTYYRDNEHRWPSRILVKLWDASGGALISNRLFGVNNVALTQFSPDGRFLAVARRYDNVIELWNLEVGKDLRQFSYPPDQFVLFLHFVPTSDSLVAGLSNKMSKYETLFTSSSSFCLCH